MTTVRVLLFTACVLATGPGARTMTLDPETHRIYLATAELKPAPEVGKRPTIVPGTLKILVFGPK